MTLHHMSISDLRSLSREYNHRLGSLQTRLQALRDRRQHLIRQRLSEEQIENLGAVEEQTQNIKVAIVDLVHRLACIDEQIAKRPRESQFA